MKFTLTGKEGKSRYEFSRKWEGVIPWLTRRYKETNSDTIRADLEGYMTANKCKVCKGQRLRAESLAVKIADISISEVTRFSIKDAMVFFADLKLSKRDAFIADKVLKEIRDRLQFMSNVGLDYLALDRGSATLSGGEGQRIRLPPR